MSLISETGIYNDYTSRGHIHTEWYMQSKEAPPVPTLNMCKPSEGAVSFFVSVPSFNSSSPNAMESSNGTKNPQPLQVHSQSHLLSSLSPTEI
ncbi:hypothetical protein E6O75_ATG05127 [Venturia nashicola]|uniref:Uncharacterized protein n=1 Tax=Venturia nashicola TaxID=86259 RepID=A0A4Z1P047_9PEZI|nr:hypothetical protein E6O75_ATG05127 [Venturia nashicola]